MCLILYYLISTVFHEKILLRITKKQFNKLYILIFLMFKLNKNNMKNINSRFDST